MTARESTSSPNPLSILPGGGRPSTDAVMVAAVMGGSLLALYGLRRGLRGIGPIELTGSGISGVEFAAYLMVVGGMIRTLQATFPDNPVVKATAFLY